jgi:hypothetical protein
MAMREECKHFQSRTYSTGEVVRFCELDLAPEAPWRCPDDCPAYERRLADVGWVHGSLVEPPVEEEPEPVGPEMALVLDEAEDIVNAAAPEVLAEVEHDEAKRSRRGRGIAGGAPGAAPRGEEAKKRRWPWGRHS